MKKYTLEKVLYFADRDEGLHVSDSEKSGTDLDNLIHKCIEREFIEPIDSAGSGSFYKTTKAGKVQLLKLQIEWRKSHGKSIDTHNKLLSELAA